MKILTKGLAWEELGNDYTIIMAKIIVAYEGKDFLFSKWKQAFLELFPEASITTKYGKVVMGMVNGLKILEEKKIIVNENPEGKNYKLVHLLNEKLLNKVAKHDFYVLEVNPDDVDEWVAVTKEGLGDNGGNRPTSKFENKEQAFNDLF